MALDRLPDFLRLAQHGITAENVVRLYFGCAPTDIHEDVITIPVLGVGMFAGCSEGTTPI